MSFERVLLLSRESWCSNFHHTTCESTCDTLSSSATNQSDNTVSVARGGTATPSATKQLLPPDRVSKIIYICKQNENYYLMPYNSQADMVRFLAERYDTKSSVKLCGFRTQLQASYVSSHTEEL